MYFFYTGQKERLYITLCLSSSIFLRFNYMPPFSKSALLHSLTSASTGLQAVLCLSLFSIVLFLSPFQPLCSVTYFCTQSPIFSSLDHRVSLSVLHTVRIHRKRCIYVNQHHSLYVMLSASLFTLHSPTSESCATANTNTTFPTASASHYKHSKL